MSITHTLIMLVPRNDFAARMQQLISPKLEKKRYPDCHIPSWKYKVLVGDQNYVNQIYSEIEKNGFIDSPPKKDTDGVVATGVEIQLGEVPEVYLPSRGYQHLYIGLRNNQGVYGEVKKDALLTLNFPFNNSTTNNHLPTRFLLEKVMEILQPTFAWSSSANQIDWDRAHFGNIAEPWRNYANTMIFGSELCERFNLVKRLTSLKDSLYYLRKLDGPVVWLSDTAGLGNEDQSWYEMEMQSAFDSWWLDFSDPALERVLNLAQEEHKYKLLELLEEL